jgi:hypothetical protein
VLLAWSWRSGGIHQTVVERWAAGWAQVGAPIDAVDRRGAPAFEGPLSVADGTRPVVATQVSGSVPGSGAGDRSIVLHEFR